MTISKTKLGCYEAIQNFDSEPKIGLVGYGNTAIEAIERCLAKIFPKEIVCELCDYEGTVDRFDNIEGNYVWHGTEPCICQSKVNFEE